MVSWALTIMHSQLLSDIGDNEHPSVVPSLNLGGRVDSIYLSGRHACVLLESGGVKCWGEGANGKLGNHSTRGVDRVSNASDVSLGGEDVLQMSAGTEGNCVLLKSGSVRCWGGQ